jgi:hypothetical protein
MQQSLAQACAEDDPDINRPAQMLTKLGPANFLSLPLETARLRETEGGRALPQLCLTSRAAFVAQLQVTLCQSMQAIASIAECQATGPVGLATSPLAIAYCEALQHLHQQSDLHSKLTVPSVALE